MTMSRTIMFATAAAVWAAALAHPGDAVAKVAKGDRATELTSIKDPGNRPIKLSAYRGKVVVLTFGASWCKPCRKELPAYEKLARRYRAAKAPVQFVAVNIDSERTNADRLIKEAGLRVVRVGFDPHGRTVAKYEPSTMPTTYVIGKKGIVRAVHPGYDKGDEESIARAVDALLD